MVRQHKFGPIDLSVVGIGCSKVGSLGNATPVSEIRQTLSAAMDAGITLFDTADVYGQGDSEKILGSVVRARRDKVFITTKVGKQFSRKVRILRGIKPAIRAAIAVSPSLRQRFVEQRRQEITRNFSLERLPGAVDASLKRLGTDYIDGLLLHSPPLAVIADPQTADVLLRLKASGKVRRFGVSVDTLEELLAAARMPGAELIQVPIATIEEALAAGKSAEWTGRGIALFSREILRPQGTPHGAPLPPLAQAIARALAPPGVAATIVGVSSRRHLNELLAAAA